MKHAKWWFKENDKWILVWIKILLPSAATDLRVPQNHPVIFLFLLFFFYKFTIDDSVEKNYSYKMMRAKYAKCYSKFDFFKKHKRRVDID